MAPRKVTTWTEMNAAPRHRPGDLTRADVPAAPGVYAWYRHGRPVYVGKADSLVNRVWKSHLGQSRSVGGSAFRRNVAEYLGFASSADIKEKRYALTEAELSAMRAWILGSRVAWLTFRTIAAARLAEVQLKEEFKPPLTKI